jgi:hypothetical protein
MQDGNHNTEYIRPECLHGSIEAQLAFVPHVQDLKVVFWYKE